MLCPSRFVATQVSVEPFYRTKGKKSRYLNLFGPRHESDPCLNRTGRMSMHREGRNWTVVITQGKAVTVLTLGNLAFLNEFVSMFLNGFPRRKKTLKVIKGSRRSLSKLHLLPFLASPTEHWVIT